MNKKELLQLLECVKDDIAEAEKEDKTLKSKLEKLTE
jgi:cell division septum initiation protein DivIVA